jgi:hypothetical protein
MRIELKVRVICAKYTPHAHCIQMIIILDF